MSAGVVLLLEVQFHAANENLKVFGNFLLLWLRGSCLQFCKHRFCLTALLVFIGQRGLGDLVVILAEPFREPYSGWCFISTVSNLLVYPLLTAIQLGAEDCAKTKPHRKTM